MAKIFTTTKEQIKILKKRGVTIKNDDRVERILEKTTYYNIINGYKDIFIDSKSTDGERYLEGTNFDEIYELYLFDNKIRALFLEYLLEIENMIKTVIANEFSKKYGRNDYLKIDNFNTSINKHDKITPAQKVGAITNLISGIQKEISNQLSNNNPMISHYILQEGYVPMWVLVNILTFGTISKFYSNLKQQDQNNISRVFNLQPAEMQSILSILTIYRNQCAHAGRLYNFRAYRKNGQPNSIKTTHIHSQLQIPTTDDNNTIYGKNDLFAIVIIFRLLLSKQTFNSFYYKLKKNLDKLESKLITVSFNVVLQKMGFPPNWKDIKDIDNKNSKK
ncbi:MAG: Abi family protein [Firmicutes bacterium]|nr:Abi family protein [Bacillota bacterium]